MTAQLEQRLFTVAEVELMAQAGIFNDDDRLELIEGVLVKMRPIGSYHASYVEWLGELLKGKGLPDIAVRSQNPIQLNEHSAPQPDLALVRLRQDRYRTRHPRPDEVLLVIEVSDSTLDYDRNTKMRMYAEAMIPEAWILDVSGKAIEQYSQPDGRAYLSVRRFGGGEELRSVAVPGLALSTTTILA